MAESYIGEENNTGVCLFLSREICYMKASETLRSWTLSHHTDMKECGTISSLVTILYCLRLSSHSLTSPSIFQHFWFVFCRAHIDGWGMGQWWLEFDFLSSTACGHLYFWDDQDSFLPHSSLFLFGNLYFWFTELRRGVVSGFASDSEKSLHGNSDWPCCCLQPCS